MTEFEFTNFIARVRPYIFRAALFAKTAAMKTITNPFFLYLVQKQEEDRLHFAAWEFKEKETVTVPRASSNPMTAEEFEYYVLNLVGLDEYPVKSTPQEPTSENDVNPVDPVDPAGSAG